MAVSMPMLSEATFPGVSVIEIDPEQRRFKTNFSNLPLLAVSTFLNMFPDQKNNLSTMKKEEFVYYATAMLWIRILHIKSKQTRVALTISEMTILQYVRDFVFNVPEPIYEYLLQIGNVTVDRTGREIEIELPALPEAVAGGLGGYHASSITQQNHNLFEEVPSLGIACDMVSAGIPKVRSTAWVPVHVAPPPGCVLTENLTGLMTDICPCYSEPRLYKGIQSDKFPEIFQRTRFHFDYICDLSHEVKKYSKTFKIVEFSCETASTKGGECQIILSKPVPKDNLHLNWTKAPVETTSATCDSKAQFGAAYVFGFQLFKEDGVGKTDTERAARWSCVAPYQTAKIPWTMPQAWIDSRNERRDLPAFLSVERFKGFGRRRQDEAMNDYVRRLVLSPR